MTREERTALTEKLRGGQATRGMPFDPGLAHPRLRRDERQGRRRQVDAHRQPRRRARRARACGSASSTPTCYGFSIPGILGSSDDADGVRA